VWGWVTESLKAVYTPLPTEYSTYLRAHKQTFKHKSGTSVRMWWRSFFILSLLTLGTYHQKQADLASCFCQLDGVLEDCPCQANTIDTFNSMLRPHLLPILNSYYFRYFQVDFSRPCTYFSGDDGQCSNPGCAVDTCTKGEVPESLQGAQEVHRAPKHEEGYWGWLLGYLRGLVTQVLTAFPVLVPYYNSASSLVSGWGLGGTTHSSCADPHPVDLAISDGHRPLLNDFCPLDPLEEGAACHYVDLTVNTERYTGYSGRASQMVWQKIYNELCFHPEKDEKSFDLTAESARSMCLEKRAFYRVVSGMHASISVHITSNYLLQEGGNGKEAVWGKNMEEFARRFAPSTTEGEGPERLKNLYFLYLLELRALVKAAPILERLKFDSGDHEEDERIKMGLKTMLENAKQFPKQFDEAKMFNTAESEELLAAFKDNFRSISLLMDCLGCERCKVWGKLQITGIGTALKVLFTEPASLALSRHELVALLNAFGRISTSIHEVNSFRNPEPS